MLKKERFTISELEERLRRLKEAEEQKERDNQNGTMGQGS